MRKIPASAAEKLHAIKQCRYFANLEGKILEELFDGTQFTAFERGETIFWQGDACPGLFILEIGSVKLFKLSPHGREMIVTILEEGETFNEVPVFDQGTNPVNAAALDASRLWIINSDSIHRTMEFHPEMCRAVIQNLSTNLRKLVGIIEELSFYQVTNRLARLISQLSAEQLSGSATRITQEQMAARLGTVREVVARSLRELERSGAIQVNRRNINIVDESALAAWMME